MAGVRLTLCESGTTILVGNPTSAAGLVLASHAGFAVWLPNYLGGVCALINIPPPGGGAIHTFTDAEVAGILQYPGCANCTANHPLPPPEEGSINFARCDTGEIIYVLDPLTDPWTTAVLDAWVGQVRYFPTIDGGICLVVGRNVLHPNPPTILLDGSDLIVATQYTDCEACAIANPGELRFSITSCCADETDVVTYYSTTNLTVFDAIPNFSIQYIPSIQQCVKIVKNTPVTFPHTPVPSDFWDGFSVINDATCCSCLEANVRAICNTYPLRITSCCFPQISYGIKGKICGQGFDPLVGGTYHINNLPDTIPSEQTQGCWNIVVYEGSAEDISIPLIILDDNNGGPSVDCELCSIKWPCPPPICYELIPCPGSFVPSLIASNDLSAYVNSVVMVNGQCYTVQPGTEDCTESQVVEIFDTFAQCGDQTSQPNTSGCVYCDCPPGYYPNEDKTECIKNTCVTPTNNGQPYRVVGTDGGPDNTWGDEGTRIYEDITSKVFPLVLTNNPPIWDVKDNNGSGTIITWVPPVLLNAFINRFSAVGIWPNENPLNEWIGITICITVTEEKIYSLGMAADSQYILKHNGTQIIQNTTTGVSAYRLWSIYQITLPVGQHVFEFFALNLAGTGGLGFEVYNADGLTLQTISPGSLPGVILFSTQILAEQSAPAYFYLGDNAYSCPPGYFLNDCDGTGTNLQCCLVPKSLPYVHCEPSYLIENCVLDNLTPPIITNTPLGYAVGKITKICIDGDSPVNPYPICNLCNPDYTWNNINGSIFQGDCKTPDNGSPFQHCYSPCNVYIVSPKGKVYIMNPYSTYSAQVLNLSGIMNSGSNIANTADRLWVLCGTGVVNYIQEFSITLSPYPYIAGIPQPPTLTWIRNINPSIPSLMYPACAKDNNILYGGFNSVVEYDISGPTAIFNTLFTLPNSGIIKDLVFLPNSGTLLILGTDSTGPFISEYSLLGVELNRAALSFTDFKGIFVDNTGNIFVIRATGNESYLISTTITWQQEALPYRSLEGYTDILGGMSQNPTCTNLRGPAPIWPEGCYCYKVTEIPFDPAGISWPYGSAALYDDCETCLKQCYTLTSCPKEGIEPTTITVDNDLSQYVGMVVKFPRLGDNCWIVAKGDCTGPVTVPGEVNGFTDCETCNPIPPPIVCMIGRPVKPGYDTPGCPSEYYERISCTFGKQAFDEMVQSRYGIKICCDHEMDKWDVRWEILKLKAIFDPSLCVTITPSPSLTLSVSYHCEGEVFILTITLVVVGGSGSYQTQQYVNGAWENLGDIYYGTKNGTIEVITTISVPEPKAFKYRVLDVICCTLGSNTIEGTFEPCACVPTITSSGSFTCTQPLDGSGTLTWNNTYHCGSGNYILQFFNKNVWNDVVTYSSITDGSDTQTFYIPRTSSGNFELRVIDADSGTIGNEFTVVFDNCLPGETIILTKTNFGCTTGIDGQITGTITVTNGSGTYHLQIFNLGTWIPLDVISGVSTGIINIYTPVLGGADAPGDYLIRIQDAVTLVISNTSQITIIACEPGVEVLEIDSIGTIACVGGDLYCTFTYIIQNPQGNVDLEYYNGISWQIAVPMVTNGGPWTTLLPDALMGQLDTGFRLHDTISGMYSIEYDVFGLIPECGIITILSNSVNCSGTTQEIGVEVNINYDNTGHNFNLEFYDGATWTYLFSYTGIGSVTFMMSGTVVWAPGTYYFRIHDTTNDLYSDGTYIGEIPDCATEINLRVVCQNAGAMAMVDFTNAYGMAGGTLVNFQWSDDNITWNNAFLPWVYTNPFTAINTQIYPGISNKNYYRVQVQNSSGGLVISNVVSTIPTTVTLNSVSAGYNFSLQNAYQSPYSLADYDIIFQESLDNVTFSNFEYYDLGSEPVTNGYFVGGATTPGNWYRITIGDGCNNPIYSNSVQAT